MLNRKCERIWDKQHHRSPFGKPNMFLLYSSLETFEPPTDVMWLGKNPGGGPEGGDLHPYHTPFTQPAGWSAYLD